MKKLLVFVFLFFVCGCLGAKTIDHDYGGVFFSFTCPPSWNITELTPGVNTVLESMNCETKSGDFIYSFEISRHTIPINFSLALNEYEEQTVYYPQGYVVKKPFNELTSVNDFEAVKGVSYSVLNQTLPHIKHYYETYAFNCKQNGYSIIKTYPENPDTKLKNELEQITKTIKC